MRPLWRRVWRMVNCNLGVYLHGVRIPFTRIHKHLCFIAFPIPRVFSRVVHRIERERDRYRMLRPLDTTSNCRLHMGSRSPPRVRARGQSLHFLLHISGSLHTCTQRNRPSVYSPVGTATRTRAGRLVMAIRRTLARGQFLPRGPEINRWTVLGQGE